MSYVDVAGLRTWTIEFLRRGYDPVSPDGPDHFAVVHAKTMQMIASEPEIALETLADVSPPTLWSAR